MAASTERLDVADLQRRVQDVYQQVAQQPHRNYHFELGRGLALRLGYPVDLLDKLPVEALESFAGVGYFLDLAAPQPGERVLDLGSGSGTDSFAAAALVGPTGDVTGVDMTKAQLAKAERLRDTAGLEQVRFVEGHIEDLPLADGSCDVVISNGVINLSADKAAAFAEAARVLVPGGRLALADIVAARPLAESITCNAELWAACSAAPRRSMTTSARSPRPACASRPPGTTPPTSSSPAPRAGRPRPTGSRASPCSPSSPEADRRRNLQRTSPPRAARTAASVAGRKSPPRRPCPGEGGAGVLGGARIIAHVASAS